MAENKAVKLKAGVMEIWSHSYA